MTVATVVDRLPTVELAELVERASLQTRVDRKYLLTPGQAGQFLDRLAETAAPRVLCIDGRRDSGYDSLYLDTPDLAGYHLAARGRRRRFKVRRRTYLETGETWLELKTRGPRGATVKQRSLEGSRAFLDDALAAAGLPDLRGVPLVPVLTTSYRRTSLLLPGHGTDTDSRLTMDAGLRWSTPDGRQLELPDRVVVETKSGAQSSTADRLLWRAGCRPARISKFGTGLAALHPTLPANRWHPVLTRHLTPRELS
jgi:hypothetical protein